MFSGLRYTKPNIMISDGPFLLKLKTTFSNISRSLEICPHQWNWPTEVKIWTSPIVDPFDIWQVNTSSSTFPIQWGCEQIRPCHCTNTITDRADIPYAANINHTKWHQLVLSLMQAAAVTQQICNPGSTFYWHQYWPHFAMKGQWHSNSKKRVKSSLPRGRLVVAAKHAAMNTR